MSVEQWWRASIQGARVTLQVRIYSPSQLQGNKSPVSPPPIQTAADQWRSWRTDRGTCAAESPRFAPFFLLGTFSAPPTTPFGAHGVSQPMGIKHALPRRRIFGAPSGACAFSFCVDGQRSATGGGGVKRRGRASRRIALAPPHRLLLLFSLVVALALGGRRDPCRVALSHPIRPRRRFSLIPVVRRSPPALFSISLPFDIAAARRKSR